VNNDRKWHGVPLLAANLNRRLDDIAELAEHLLSRSRGKPNVAGQAFTDDTIAALKAHVWPGNVRELANAIERALVVGTPPAVRVGDLLVRLSENGGGTGAVDDSLAAMERAHVARVLGKSGGNVTHAAAALGIDRVTLYNKIKKYDLRR